MTRLLVDTSVVFKWFHASGESELAAARALRDAHVRAELYAHILDLGVYEVGNVLARALKWTSADVAGQLDDLIAILGPPLAMAHSWLRDAASLAERHGLTFYDASWSAAARALDVALVSADRVLIAAGLAESPTAAATRLRLAV